VYACVRQEKGGRFYEDWLGTSIEKERFELIIPLTASATATITVNVNVNGPKNPCCPGLSQEDTPNYSLF
jgi:hypothetical protein